jgi:hypothetical protein
MSPRTDNITNALSANPQACLTSYQDQEETNPECALYAEWGLGTTPNRLESMVINLIEPVASNRMESVASMTDYVCAEPTAPA